MGVNVGVSVGVGVSVNVGVSVGVKGVNVHSGIVEKRFGRNREREVKGCRGFFKGYEIIGGQ